MAGIKLYESKAWLTRQYQVNKLTPEEIGKRCNASQRTIYTKLKEFGLIKKR